MVKVKLRDQLKGMSRKDQIDHLWEYYKWHLVTALVLISFVWLFIDGLMSKGNEPVGVTVVSEANLEVIDELEMEILNLNYEDFDVYFEHIQHQGGLIEDNALDLMERLAMRIGVGQVDIMVTNAPFAEQLASERVFMPLDEVIPEELVVDYEDEALVVDDVLYGIPTADLNIFDQYDVYQNTYLLVPASGEKKEEAAVVITDLIEN